MPITLKSPGFSLDYYPSFITALRRADSFTLSPQHLSGTNTPLVTHPSSYNSSLGDPVGNPWIHNASDPVTPYSIGGTPPMSSHLGARNQAEHSSIQSMSSSPEQHHNHSSFQVHPKKSTGISNLTSGITRALLSNAHGGLGAVMASGFNGLSSSPPTRRSKAVSPDQQPSSFGAVVSQQQHPSVVTWAAEPQYRSKGRTHSEIIGQEYVQEEDELDMGEDECLVDLQFCHLEQFDDEGMMNVPLLEQSKSRNYRRYRETYADMLYTWDLPLQRLEILKFNGLKAVNDVNLEKLDSFSRKRNSSWDGLGNRSLE